MIKLNNYAKPLDIRGGTQYYKWKIFVDQPDDVLREIKEIEYQLHPTFPKPHQVRYNPGDKFALESAGWGEFTIAATVRFHDGHTERVVYWLDLSRPWPEEVVQAS